MKLNIKKLDAGTRQLDTAINHPDSLTPEGKNQYFINGLFESVKSFTSKLEFFRVYRIAYQQNKKTK